MIIVCVGITGKDNRPMIIVCVRITWPMTIVCVRITGQGLLFV
jgi:hypothetical protein